MQVVESDEQWSLVIVEHNDVEYIALKYEGTEWAFSELYFDGLIKSNAPENIFKSFLSSDLDLLGSLDYLTTKEIVMASNVGIGTTDPGEKLVIGNHGLSMHDGGNKALSFGGDYQHSTGWVRRGGVSYQGLIIFSPSNGSIQMYSTNSDVGTSGFVNKFLTMSGNTGNVGIGTTNPSEKFDVSGGNVKANQFVGYMNSRGRVCPHGHYYAMGYCLEKTLHYTPHADCSGTSGSLHNGVCQNMSGTAGSCAHGTLKEAYDACDNDGGRIPTPAELDRLDGSGCGFDRASTWVQFAESGTEVNHSYTGIGQCVRKNRHLVNAPLDVDQESGFDEIAHCNHIATFDHRNEYTSGQIGAIHCVYDP